MIKSKLIRNGSAKDIYRFDKKTIAFEMTNDYSVFDVGKAHDKIPSKGAAICACAVKSFQIAEAIGVPTHFIEQLSSTMIRVREVRIIKDRSLTLKDANYLVPLELIYRLRVAGSILRDFKSGKKDPENFGLSAGIVPEIGTPFPYPVHMVTTKLEDIDRELKLEEACELSGITLRDLSEYWSMIDRLTGAIALALSRAGLGLTDGKMEVLMGPGRKKMIGDVFGTPDEDRFYKIDEGPAIHYSKEYLREIHINSGYYASLQEARRKELSDPPIPRLSEEQIAEASRRYKLIAKLYAGVNI